MKKTRLLALALMALPLGVIAQTEPEHDAYVLWGEDDTEWQEAYQTWEPGVALYGEDSESADYEEFFRSRVKPRERFTFSETQVDPSMDASRKLLWWCPIGVSGWNATPTYFYGSEVYSVWNYTDIFGNWTAGFVRMPAAMLDVCHKNGVQTSVLASVPWDDYVDKTDHVHGRAFAAMIDGGYDKFLKYLRYYGIDGIGFNSEFTFSPTSFGTEMKEFLSNLSKYKNDYEWPAYHNCWYSLMNNSSGLGGGIYLNDSNCDWFHYNGSSTSDAYFMNYGFSSTTLNYSQTTATSFSGRSSFDVYAGVDLQGRTSENWSSLSSYDISLGLWGAHNTNMMYMAMGENGSSAVQKQQTYQLISENLFTGSSFNPVNTPAIQGTTYISSKATTWHGFSSYLAAKSSLTTDDLATDPFVTYFNLGNGIFFKDKGETTYDGEWYNLGVQDYLPTWRWWWTSSFMGRENSDVSTDLTAAFTWDDAWFGGSCLQITGETDQTYLQLFKTKYATESNSDMLTFRYKVVSGTGTIAWACSTEDAPSTEVSSTIVTGASASDEWIEVKTSIGTGRNDYKIGDATLALMGLKFTNTSADFKIYIGEIALTRGTSATPSAPIIKSSKLLNYSYKGFDIQTVYEMASGNTDVAVPVYNSDVNTWLFKIYTRQEGGEASLICATTSWGAYAVSAPYDAELGGKVQIGISAISLDGDSESEISWGELMELGEATIYDGTEIDKEIIKSGEEFTLKFVDPNHGTADWTILNAITGEEVYSANGVTSLTTSFETVGLYDVIITDADGTESYTRGLIQVSPLTSGAIPTLELFTADKEIAEVGESINLSYTASRLGEGTVSRAVQIQDPTMLHFPTMIATRPYTYMMWFNLSSISHDTQGTNLIQKTKFDDTWPHDNWGDFWVQIRPEGYAYKELSSSSTTPDVIHAENEISYNVYGWTEHDFANTDMMSTDYSVKTGQWTHIAISLSSDGTEKMWFNGKLVAETVDLHISSNGQRRNGDVYVGGAGTYKSGIDGYIDDFQVWDRVLSDAEVAEAMNGYINDEDIPEGLIGYWDFEEVADNGLSFMNRGTYGNTEEWYADCLVSSDVNDDDRVTPSINEMGSPMLQGSLTVETTMNLETTGATVNSTSGSMESGSTSISYAAAGIYTAKLTLENMWGSDTQTIDYIQIGNVTGVESTEVAETLGVYPNPFTDFVNIRFAEGGIYTAQIVAIDGKVIENKQLFVSAGEGVRVDVDGDSGIYILRVINNDGVAVSTIKIIKK